MIKVGVIGCGNIANSAHIPAYLKNSDVEIAYFCDIIPQRAEKAVKDYGCGKAVTDYQVILDDPTVDAVSVCTPNKMHSIITIAALKAGKHVLCEKPAARTYAEAEEMQKTAQETGKILNIGVVNRFNDAVNKIRTLIQSGELGDVFHVYVSFRSQRSIPGLGGDFTNSAVSGGGVLIDWGVHFFDLILYILGNAKLVNLTCDAYSEMAKDMKSYKYKSMWAEDTSDVENGTNDVEDLITGYIRTDKASISFNGAWAQNINQNEMFIDFLGDKCGARLTYGGKFEIYDGATLETIQPEYDIPQMHAEEDKAFIESLYTGEKTRSHIDNVLESAKLLDALYQSSKIKKEISFE